MLKYLNERGRLRIELYVCRYFLRTWRPVYAVRICCALVSLVYYSFKAEDFVPRLVRVCNVPHREEFADCLADCKHYEQRRRNKSFGFLGALRRTAASRAISSLRFLTAFRRSGPRSLFLRRFLARRAVASSLARFRRRRGRTMSRARRRCGGVVTFQ